MPKKQKYVYLQLYSKDLLADEKLAKCDKASAWGAYLALLNIMALEPIRGCVRLRDWDTHPRNERHSLVANFRKANSLRTKAAAFAHIVSQCTPLKPGPMTEGIEQLVTFGVLVMHDDALIQTRMFRDSRSVLDGYDPWTEDSPATPPEYAGKMVNTITKDIRPAQNAHARTLIGIENENESRVNIDSISYKGGAGENEGGAPAFDEFWTLYDKKRTTEGALIDAGKCREAWDMLTVDQQREAIAFLPAYIKATPVKKYRMAPANYLSQQAWRTIEIDDGKAVNRKDMKTPENDPDEGVGVQNDGLKAEKEADGTDVPQEAVKPVSGADLAKKDGIGDGSAAAAVNGDVQADKIPVADRPPTLREVQDYMQQRGEGGDPFRHITAEEFYDDGCQNGWTIRGGQPLSDWRARLRSLEGYRRKNGEPTVTREGYVAYHDGKLVGTLAVRPGQQQGRGQPVTRPQPKAGDPVAATKPRAGKYSKW